MTQLKSLLLAALVGVLVVACLPACPTGALTTPGVLDARRCLAYWLQAPGEIPRPLRIAVGDRLYGCDDCIEVCPPGSRLLEGADSVGGDVDLLELLALDDYSLLAAHSHFYVPDRRARGSAPCSTHRAL